MNEPTPKPELQELPAGWGWATWSGRTATETMWAGFDEKVRQAFRQRFMEIVAGMQVGRPLAKEKVHYDQGIGKAKVKKPNPGWRGYFFQDGQERYVTHFTQKNEDEHASEIEKALAAKAAHMARKGKK